MTNEPTRCSRTACEGKTLEGIALAQWQVGLTLFAGVHLDPEGVHGAPARMGLFVCDACKPLMTLESVLTDDGWAVISAAFVSTGKAATMRSRTTLEFYPREDWVNASGRVA